MPLRPAPRRGLLAATVCIALALAAGEGSPAAAIEDLPNPPEIVARDGVLRGKLTIAPARVTVAGRSVVSNVINGSYLAPTLRVRRGDTIVLEAVNRIGKALNIAGPQPTNVHYHGMDVSPIPPGDSVFIRIRPKADFGYRVPIPADHPQGLHWYHAHVHHFVEDQIGSGVSGMLIVDGFIERQYPELAGLRQRVMVLKDFTFAGFQDGQARSKSLNGYADPPIRARPGEFQVWEIGNLGADAFFDLQLAGHPFWVIERDGNLLLDPVRQDSLFLPPGARAAVVVEAGAAGRYPLRSLPVDTGPQGDPNPKVKLGTFIVGGEPVGGGAAIRARLRRGPADPGDIQPNPIKLAEARIDRTRYIDFSESADGDTFFINNKTYDENRVDTTVRLGQVEKWIVRNFSGEDHVFHLHQTEFLVTRVSGGEDAILGLGMRDVVNVPYARNGKPGVAELVIPFTNPVMVGEFVYHCHIVGHEDAGMMANIAVLPTKTLAEDVWDRVTRLAGLALPAPWSTAVAEQQAPDLLAELESTICRARPDGALTAADVAYQ
jgi:FtsP/CotA-like multicopper oxidase with cupredoxin domain